MFGATGPQGYRYRTTSAIEALEGRQLLSSVVYGVSPTGLIMPEMVHASSTIVKAVVAKPAAPSIPALASASDSGVKGDHITNVTKPTFTGTAVDKSTVKIYNGATLVGTGTATSTGTYSVTLTTALSNGVKSITATATTSAGTSPASKALSLTIQTTAPAAPSAPAIVSSTTLTPTFTGTAVAGDTVTIYADGKSAGTGVATSGKYSVKVGTLTAGTHSISATTTDVAGNVSAKSAAVTVKLSPVVNTPEVEFSYVTSQSTYSVAPKGTVTVEVFLKETLPAGAKSLIVANGGVAGAGFSVTRTSATTAGLTGIAGSISSNGSNFAGGFFYDQSGGSSSNQAGVDLIGPGAATGVNPNAKDANGVVDEIEIGTVTIVAGATAGTTKFTLANFSYPDPSGGWSLTRNGAIDLDVTQTGATPYIGASSNPESFSVTVT